jgi:hypothetical protein
VAATGWFAEPDDWDGWQPTLQLEDMCLSLMVSFDTVTACNEFIRNDILTQGELP